MRSSLIVVEIALSFALLVGAGLLTRSFVALQRTPLGFDPHNLVSVDVFFGPAIRRAGRAIEVRQAILARLRETPGIVGASLGTLPTAGFRDAPTLEVDTGDGPRDVGISQFQKTWIEGDYFGASRITLLAGRAPNAGASDESLDARAWCVLRRGCREPQSRPAHRTRWQCGWRARARQERGRSDRRHRVRLEEPTATRS